MESNEQTELTSKVETDSQIESRPTALGWGIAGGGIEQNRKKTHGPRNRVMIPGWRGWVKVEEGIKGINGYRKNIIKMN